jgi:hypothetical protein
MVPLYPKERAAARQLDYRLCIQVGRNVPGAVIASKAKQSPIPKGGIASSLALLAMTSWSDVAFPPKLILYPIAPDQSEIVGTKAGQNGV